MGMADPRMDADRIRENSDRAQELVATIGGETMKAYGLQDFISHPNHAKPTLTFVATRNPSSGELAHVPVRVTLTGQGVLVIVGEGTEVLQREVAARQWTDALAAVLDFLMVAR